MSEFSWRTRERALADFRTRAYDLLIVGGGITGAAVARDAASRGLKVALVERRDFAWGTSSRSSKLIHGGLRYLENLEFKLVFEALAERALLLKTAPHMVRPLKFFLPVYKGDAHGKGILSLGLWLYDLLALIRTPEFHRRYSREKLLKQIPFLKSDGLEGGFSYFDASMWDDGLVIENLRAAHDLGAAIANYTEAMKPLWKGDCVNGFVVRDVSGTGSPQPFELRAKRVIVCGGPWTDAMAGQFFAKWTPWLKPSKGVHLIFDLKRLPVPGAMVMSHPSDGRISFVIPRVDYGNGVVIVGTTDDDAPGAPEQAEVESNDVDYLMALLNRYFPDLKLTTADIVNAYVGVRPLMNPNQGGASGSGLRKVSREHHIDLGPGGVTLVAGGKYTTARTMAEEIVDFALKAWKRDAGAGLCEAYPAVLSTGLGKSNTRGPVNPRVFENVDAEGHIPAGLIDRFGGDARAIQQLAKDHPSAFGSLGEPEGYNFLAAQLRHQIRTGMVLKLEDFLIRRSSLFLTRADHGRPWVQGLAKIWAEELGRDAASAAAEVEAYEAECARRSRWRERLGS